MYILYIQYIVYVQGMYIRLILQANLRTLRTYKAKYLSVICTLTGVIFKRFHFLDNRAFPTDSPW
jgi:predicted alpha-1,6-mannanase (GH76 family)